MTPARVLPRLSTLGPSLEALPCLGRGLPALRRRTASALARQLASHPEGRRLLAERPPLGQVLTDVDALARLPRGSLGRGYAQLVGTSGGTRTGSALPLPSTDVWLAEWLDAVLTLAHLLTGYGADRTGELATLAFVCGQTRAHGTAARVFAAACGGSGGRGGATLRLVLQAWRRGRSAGALAVLRYELLLPRSLVVLRQSLGILPNRRAHPQGLP